MEVPNYHASSTMQDALSCKIEGWLTPHRFSFTLQRLFLLQKRVSLDACLRTEFLSGFVRCQKCSLRGARSYRSSKAIPTESTLLHSPRTASCWHRRQT